MSFVVYLNESEGRAWETPRDMQQVHSARRYQSAGG